MGETVNGGKGIPVYQAYLIFYYITPTAKYLGSYMDFHYFTQLQTFSLRNSSKSGQHYFWILLMVTRSWNYIHRMVICLSELSCNTAKWHLRKKHKYSASPYTLNTFCIIIWLIFCYILTSRKQHCEIIFVHARILIHCSFTHRRTRKQSNAEQAQIRKYIIRYTIKISIKYQTKLSLCKYGIWYVQRIFT